VAFAPVLLQSSAARHRKAARPRWRGSHKFRSFHVSSSAATDCTQREVGGPGLRAQTSGLESANHSRCRTRAALQLMHGWSMRYVNLGQRLLHISICKRMTCPPHHSDGKEKKRYRRPNESGMMKAFLHRGVGLTVDQLLCGTLAVLHQRHGRRTSTRETVEEYLAACENLTRAQYFVTPATLENFRHELPDFISWSSSAKSVAEFPVNGRVRVRLHRAHPGASTVIMLHSLMSASDVGYRFWARRFNQLGWNVAFVHLPFHHSRRPRGYLNGELCCTADLVLTGDTLRQAVVEIRQLIAWLQMQGDAGIGLIGTSYGGWIAALLASLQPELRFVALLAPMVNIVHALYEGPTSWTIRRQLARGGLDRALIDRHAHLSSPLHAQPAGNVGERTLIIGGSFDRIVSMADLVVLRNAWRGSELITVPQAHFGYGMIPCAVEWLRQRGLLAPV
jgi:Esterase/lipase